MDNNKTPPTYNTYQNYQQQQQQTNYQSFGYPTQPPMYQPSNPINTQQNQYQNAYNASMPVSSQPQQVQNAQFYGNNNNNNIQANPNYNSFNANYPNQLNPIEQVQPNTFSRQNLRLQHPIYPNQLQPPNSGQSQSGTNNNRFLLNYPLFRYIMQYSSHIPKQLRDKYNSGQKKYQYISYFNSLFLGFYVGYGILMRRTKWFRVTTNWRIMFNKVLTCFFISSVNSTYNARYTLNFYKNNKSVFQSNWQNITKQIEMQVSKNIMKFKDLDLGYKNNRNNNNSMGSTSDISSSNNTNTNNSTGSYTTART